LPSFAEELARMQWLKANNKVSDDERCKLVFPRIEAKKRVKNVEGRTKLIIQLDTAETYSEFSAQFARYKDMTGNPQLAFELMLSLLRAPSDESLRRYAEGAKT
jgi:hypothetical protein